MTQHTPRRCSAVRALAVLAAMATVACGDDEAASVQTLEITADANGALNVPATAPPGATQITLDNRGKGDAKAQLVRIEGDRSTKEVFGAVAKAISGKPWDDFFFASGGVGMTPPGESNSVTQELEAGGTYYVFNQSAGERPRPADLHKLEIAGKNGPVMAETDGVISATEYEFAAHGLTSGRTEVTFENAGSQPHHVLVGQLREGATITEAKRFLLSDRQGGGSGPFPPTGSEAATSVLEGGTSQVIELDLKPGRYAFYCFISNREGGPPHAVEGMVSEVTSSIPPG